MQEFTLLHVWFPSPYLQKHHNCKWPKHWLGTFAVIALLCKCCQKSQDPDNIKLDKMKYISSKDWEKRIKPTIKHFTSTRMVSWLRLCLKDTGDTHLQKGLSLSVKYRCNLDRKSYLEGTDICTVLRHIQLCLPVSLLRYHPIVSIAPSGIALQPRQGNMFLSLCAKLHRRLKAPRNT